MITSVEQLYRLVLKPKVVILYMVMIVVSFIYLDKPIAEYCYSLHLGENHPWVVHLTNLAWGGVYIPGLLLLTLFFRFVVHNEYWRQTLFLWLCLVVPSIFGLIMKVVMGRARPTLWLGKSVYGFQWFQLKADFWSFPSGHTLNFMGLMFGFALLYPRYFKPLMCLGLVIISTRVLLHAHYLSDVMMASLLSLVVIGTMHQWLKKNTSLGQSLWRVNEQAI